MKRPPTSVNSTRLVASYKTKSSLLNLFSLSMFVNPNNFLSKSLTTCAQYMALGHSRKAILLTAIIVVEPTAITKRKAN